MSTMSTSAWRRDLIVIGASAGGLEPLRAIVASLPPTLPAAVCIVLHVGNHCSVLADILARAGALAVADAVDGSPLRRGQLYVAPPDVHLTVGEDVVHVTRGAKENLVRPAIDPLFRTAAASYGARTIGVILSGTMDDGVAGMLTIARAGGTTIVQSPDDAAEAALPRNVLEVLQPTRVLAAAGIARELVALAGTAVHDPRAARRRDVTALEIANRPAEERAMDPFGTCSAPTCPECRGVPGEARQDDTSRSRCHTGHAFGRGASIEGQVESIESALWGAIRSLRESAELAERLAARARANQHAAAAERFAQRAQRANDQAQLLVQLVREPVRRVG